MKVFSSSCQILDWATQSNLKATVFDWDVKQPQEIYLKQKHSGWFRLCVLVAYLYIIPEAWAGQLNGTLIKRWFIYFPLLSYSDLWKWANSGQCLEKMFHEGWCVEVHHPIFVTPDCIYGIKKINSQFRHLYTWCLYWRQLLLRWTKGTNSQEHPHKWNDVVSVFYHLTT